MELGSSHEYREVVRMESLGPETQRPRLWSVYGMPHVGLENMHCLCLWVSSMSIRSRLEVVYIN